MPRRSIKRMRAQESQRRTGSGAGSGQLWAAARTMAIQGAPVWPRLPGFGGQAARRLREMSRKSCKKASQSEVEGQWRAEAPELGRHLPSYPHLYASYSFPSTAAATLVPATVPDPFFSERSKVQVPTCITRWNETGMGVILSIDFLEVTPMSLISLDEAAYRLGLVPRDPDYIVSEIE